MYREVLSIIKQNGHCAYLVGGSVRDMLMGKKNGDYDICTSAYPYMIKEMFPNCQVVETGIKHGTVTLIYKKIPFEITVFRSEKGYTDHRHPDTVTFGATLEEDLSRRDFTINALCYDGERIIDKVCGVKDIENRIIRTVGDPYKRFEEDALRILRGLRFACTLGFEIEENTANAMRHHAESMQKVSAERIYSEFKKCAVGKSFKRVYAQYYDIFAKFIPNAINDEKVFGSATEAKNALKSLKADKQSIRLAEAYFSAPMVSPIRLLRLYGEETARFICEKRNLQNEYALALESGTPYKLTMLDIKGNEIGDIIGDKSKISLILNTLLDMVMDGEIENKREILKQKVVDIAI